MHIDRGAEVGQRWTIRCVHEVDTRRAARRRVGKLHDPVEELPILLPDFISVSERRREVPETNHHRVIVGPTGIRVLLSVVDVVRVEQRLGATERSRGVDEHAMLTRQLGHPGIQVMAPGLETRGRLCFSDSCADRQTRCSGAHAGNQGSASMLVLALLAHLLLLGPEL